MAGTSNSILDDLKYDAGEGALRFRGVRYLLIRPETLASFQHALEGTVGAERAGELLYTGGFTGGRLSGQKYRETLGLSAREAVEFMCRMGGEIGWGNFRLEELDLQAGRLAVAVESSPFAAAYDTEAPSGAPAPHGACHLIRGVLAGLANTLFEGEVASAETQCAAVGDPLCYFEILRKQGS